MKEDRKKETGKGETEKEMREEESTNSDISAGKLTRREIRERNLRCYRMVKTRKGLKYEEDLSAMERKSLQEEESRYNINHVGKKIIEAYLTPSAQVGNSEANKNKILRFVRGKGLRVQVAKDRGFSRVELEFDNYQDANA